MFKRAYLSFRKCLHIYNALKCSLGFETEPRCYEDTSRRLLHKNQVSAGCVLKQTDTKGLHSGISEWANRHVCLIPPDASLQDTSLCPSLFLMSLPISELWFSTELTLCRMTQTHCVCVTYLGQVCFPLCANAIFKRIRLERLTTTVLQLNYWKRQTVFFQQVSSYKRVIMLKSALIK